MPRATLHAHARALRTRARRSSAQRGPPRTSARAAWALRARARRKGAHLRRRCIKRASGRCGRSQQTRRYAFVRAGDATCDLTRAPGPTLDSFVLLLHLSFPPFFGSVPNSDCVVRPDGIQCGFKL